MFRALSTGRRRRTSMRDLSEAPIRWAIAGTGAIATQFAQALAIVEGAELAAVASRDPERAAAFGDQFSVPEHSSYEAIAESDGVDVVYVATPHTMHEHHALLYLAGGKAVLVEKPFAVNEPQALRMIDAARRDGVFLMEAMWSRFLPSYVQLIELLGQGVIGVVQMVDGNLGYQTPADRSPAKFDRERAGGSLLDLGVYPVQLCSLVL